MEPTNPLYDRYASREMAAIFSPRHRYLSWRRLWVTLAQCEADLGLPIRPDQLAALERVEGQIDFERVAELERATRHDVVAHLRHFAELAGEAGGILHLGATSAFLTDNADLLLQREGLELLAGRLGAVIAALGAFAERWADLPCLAYTHFQPAQLTTVGKRACLWLQDFLLDLDEVERRLQGLRCRGVKGTTGTQASFLTLFAGDEAKVRELDRLVAARLGFAGSFPVSGQTYPRKQDSQVLFALAGIGESCHKLGTDLRLLQGVGELAEPFDELQVGSSAMAYKRNPVRSERMCGLARRLITDSLNGPLNAATQWLERSLDDSANRRLAIPDSFLTADAAVNLAAHIAQGLQVRQATVDRRVRQELPFMATESWLMAASLRGGDRQELHERLRRHSLIAQAAVERGEPNPLVASIAADPAFGLSAAEIEAGMDPRRFTGRATAQTREFLAEVLRPRLAGLAPGRVEAPRV